MRQHDNDLMLLVAQGDIDKLGILFERYKTMLFKFFYNVNRDAALSEDLVQTVFMRILHYRERFRGEGEFTHWMFRIARNVHTDHFRASSKRKTQDLSSIAHLYAAGEPHDYKLQRAEEVRIMREALEMIDPAKREVIVLGKLQGMQYATIAEILGLSEGAVKVRMFRGLKELKEQYHRLIKQ